MTVDIKFKIYQDERVSQSNVCMCEMMSKGWKEALTVLIITHVTHVEGVKRSLNSFNCYSCYSCQRGQKNP